MGSDISRGGPLSKKLPTSKSKSILPSKTALNMGVMLKVSTTALVRARLTALRYTVSIFISFVLKLAPN
jgi:hypothetical protein